MKNFISNLNTLDLFEKAEYFHIGHFILNVFVLIVECGYSKIGIIDFFTYLALLVVFYNLFTKTLKNLYYTFWTFTFFISIYLVKNSIYYFFSDPFPQVGLIYLLSLILLLIEAHSMSSPFFFPRIRWWEYDFRYRGDLKVEVFRVVEDLNLVGRLTDIRRKAGCLVLFEDLDVGERIQLKLPFLGKEAVLRVRLMSKRQYSLGRGLTYGVEFILDSEKEHRKFLRLMRYWKVRKRAKIRGKFRNSNAGDALSKSS
ncbi:MAG: PilZ domain-containing protein [Bacteriovoracaceae bacterium]|jgi:hypothetical protein|nr:PilZ domain-containing protein [Bacteriovoracaceae bacterium]